MIFQLSLTGHYGDSPEDPNYRKLAGFDINTDEPDDALEEIKRFVEGWLIAELVEAYNSLELAWSQCKLVSDICMFITTYSPDYGKQAFRYDLTDDACYCYELRIYPAD